MGAQALKSGLAQWIGRRGTHRPLRTVLQQLMNQPTGTSSDVPAPLAGRRILLAACAASLAEPLRHAGAEVLHARPGAPLPEQLRAVGRVDALVLALAAPDALACARAIRAGGDAWAAIPLLGLAANPNACAEAAAAAGIDGLLAEPLETTLLYETLTRFITGGAARAPRIQPPAPALVTSVVPEALLNVQRLQSYQRVGMLEEVIHDYLPELRRLLANLQEAAARSDLQGTQAALHSLLGMSGEAGAQAFYQQVRKLYVPLLEHGQWPAAPDWLPQLQQLAARTEEALKAYSTGQAHSGAA